MEAIGDDARIHLRCIINRPDHSWFTTYHRGHCVKEVGRKGNAGFKAFTCFAIGRVCVSNGNNNSRFNQLLNMFRLIIFWRESDFGDHITIGTNRINHRIVRGADEVNAVDPFFHDIQIRPF
ncbi:Uncharacterised protein [Vibrio cholerae]|nr:Uncharacterised protein [Vibrio cholerae]CSC53687.1 Uncharacterised protein [Vibrio cholerae]CSD30455.1 Uncharacterised protein [Vibrio cholerae]